MIDIIKIATFLEDKLNQNLSGFTFRVYTFEKTLDNRYERDEKDSPYEITPAIITTPVGSYLPMNQMRGMRLSFNLEALIPLSKKENWIEMINEFVWSVNGKVFLLKRYTYRNHPNEALSSCENYLPSAILWCSRSVTVHNDSTNIAISTD